MPNLESRKPRVGLVAARPGLALMVSGALAPINAEVIALGTFSDSIGRGCLVVLGDPIGMNSGGSDGPKQAVDALVHLSGEQSEAAALANRFGVVRTVELPCAGLWLTAWVRGLVSRSSVVAVAGAVGGVGTTVVSVALAAAAVGDRDRDCVTHAANGTDPSPDPGCLLVDGDLASAGIDLAMGVEPATGSRWASIPSGSAPLIPGTLVAGLPKVRGISVLSGDSESGCPNSLGDPRWALVMDAARRDFQATAVDVGRGPIPLTFGPTDALVVVVPGSLAGLVGARRLLVSAFTDRIVLAVRPSKWLSTTDISEELGVDLVVQMEAIRGLAEGLDCGDILSGRTARSLLRLGASIWSRIDEHS